MALRYTEEEFAELMRRRRGEAKTSSVSPAASHLPHRGKAGEADTSSGPAGHLPNLGWAEKKRAKYGNRKVEIDGMKFDSQHEADYYFGTLLPLWRAGEYKMLARQVPFDLPGGIKYIADFVTVGMDGEVRVIDAKSAATRRIRTYINKKKQMKAIWRIEIVEV